MSDTSKQSNSDLIKRLATAKVLPDPASIDERVGGIQSAHPDALPDELARRAVKSSARKLGGLGAAAALPGAVPIVGTGTQVIVSGTTVTAETWAVLRELTALHLTIAGLYGHSVYDDDRRDELLVVWGIEVGAIVPAAEVGKQLGEKVAVAQVNRHISGAMLKKLNQRLGRQVFTKFGTKRGSIALGRVIPLGVGVAISGGVNYTTVRSFGAAAIRYYSDLLPHDGEVVLVR